MGVALYRKYRSRSLDEVVGQDHITSTLKNALKNGKISHAYLLTGPRGVGKTSIARILAFQVNDLPYDESSQPLDIIEIDAASNRRIDEVRDLRDKVHVLPASAPYKVYIIDEVHMLTREAFNALLKTLEEPPAHVIFILATTEAHKLPETIVSRTQHFAFKPISADKLVNHLLSIAQKEKITIDEDALQLIATHGGGSFRDSISLLDQARNLNDHVTKEHVLMLLGLAPEELILKIADTVQKGTPQELLAYLQSAKEQGVQATILARQLSQVLRQRCIEGTFDDMNLLKDLVEIPASSSPERLLELLLLDALPAQPGQSKKPLAPVAETEPTEVPDPPVRAVDQPKPENKTEDKKTIKHDAPNTTSKQQGNGSFSIDDWPAVLASIKKKHNTLYGILRMAEASMEDDTIRLSFRFAFHQKQINDARNQQIIKDTLHDLFNTSPAIECHIFSKPTAKAPAKDSKAAAAAVESVSNIFGGAEVLES